MFSGIVNDEGLCQYSNRSALGSISLTAATMHGTTFRTPSSVEARNSSRVCARPTIWTTSSICSRSFFPRRMVETHFPWRTGARIDIPRRQPGISEVWTAHPHDGPVEVDGAGGAEELRIAEAEDPAVGGYQAAACPCGGCIPMISWPDWWCAEGVAVTSPERGPPGETSPIAQLPPPTRVNRRTMVRGPERRLAHQSPVGAETPCRGVHSGHDERLLRRQGGQEPG